MMIAATAAVTAHTRSVRRARVCTRTAGGAPCSTELARGRARRYYIYRIYLRARQYSHTSPGNAAGGIGHSTFSASVTAMSRTLAPRRPGRPRLAGGRRPRARHRAQNHCEAWRGAPSLEWAPGQDRQDRCLVSVRPPPAARCAAHALMAAPSRSRARSRRRAPSALPEPGIAVSCAPAPPRTPRGPSRLASRCTRAHAWAGHTLSTCTPTWGPPALTRATDGLARQSRRALSRRQRRRQRWARW
mmetsp:Transcript_16248/g.42076  ORF Transcript_16248/g.42076 Transcript_16248/m.42076 type:complete len:245 (+) Transcript_16248:82-816(+)